MITHHNIIPVSCAQQNEQRHFHSGKIGQCPEQIMSFRKQRMFSIISLKAQVCASASTDYEKADARSRGILRQRLGNRADLQRK